MIKIIPSIMAKGKPELERLLRKYDGVAKELHLDIVDGKFAASHSLDFKFKLPSRFKYHVHLMVKNPLGWISKHSPGVDLCIVQSSEITDKSRFISWMKNRHNKIGFALRPREKVSALKPYLKDIDYILILTVNPGFYGSRYLKKPLQKIKEIKRINPRIKIIVDGGMNPETAKDAVKAGADIIVCGSYLSKAKNVKSAMKVMKDQLRSAK